MAQLNKVDMLIGGRVRLRRIQLGIALASLAANVRIPEGRLQAFEAGRERIGAQLLVEIARALGVPSAYFFQAPILEDPAEVALKHKFES